MKKTILFLACLLLSGCTASMQKKALCYSGCVLASVPACVRQCENTQGSATYSVAPKAMMERAKELQKKEEEKAKKK